MDETYAGTVITDLVSGRADSQPSAFNGFKQHQILAVCEMGKYYNSKSLLSNTTCMTHLFIALNMCLILYYLTGQAYSMSQNIDVAKDLPYGMNKNYIDVIKPSGILRNWIISKGQRTGVVDLLTMHMIFEDSKASTSQEIGEKNINIVVDSSTDLAKETSFAFSKASSAKWRLTQTADIIRYLTISIYAWEGNILN